MTRLRVMLGGILAVGCATALIGAAPAVASSVVHRAADGHSLAATAPAFDGSASTSTEAMRYHGGRVLAHPRVYIDFWGSEWGAADAQGLPTIDPLGVAPALVDFFRHLGGRGDTWSTILTQYCDGAAMDATSCGPRTRRIARLAGSPLRGLWVDTSTALPVDYQGSTNLSAGVPSLEVEIDRVLDHFHAANPDDIVVLAEPPDYQSIQCTASHSAYTTAQHGQVAAFLLPYPVPAQTCGSAPVCVLNLSTAVQCLPTAAQAVTELASHEYAETVTDTYGDAWSVTGEPAGQRSPLGVPFEIADACPAFAMIQLNGEKVAVDTLWSNSANDGRGGCVSRYVSPKEQG